MVRGGPGLGSIQPAQSDYYQATRGGGHGDYRMVVLAPASIQEGVELVQEAFDIADTYRMPVMLLGDGMLGQMMEPVEFGTYTPREVPAKDWATVGTGGKRKPNIVNSLYMDPAVLERMNLAMDATYEKIKKTEVKCEQYMTEDAELVLAAYGTTARIAKSAISIARKELGIRSWPHPPDYALALPGGGFCADGRAGFGQGLPERRDEHRPDGRRRAPERERQKAGSFLRRRRRYDPHAPRHCGENS